MTTLQTADGRLLRRQRPAGLQTTGGSPFSPMWSSGEREPNGLTDTFPGVLVSYDRVYRSQPVIAAVVDKLARRIATLPFQAFKELPNGSRERVFGDSLDSLIRRPMPRFPTVLLNHHIAQSLLVHGNAVVAKLRGADRDEPPMMLWPLDWAQMSAFAQQGGRIEGWATSQFDGVERYIDVADTLHFAWGAPDGSEIGVSPLEKLGVTVAIEDAAQRHQVGQFHNGVRPSLAISLAQDNPSQQLLDYAKARVEEGHRGLNKAGGVLFTGANVKVQPLSLTAVEAELIEQRKLSREEVGMVYDLAGPLMNDLSHATLANVAEYQKAMYRDVIPPWTELIVQTYQAQLLDLEAAWFDRVVRFDFTEKLRGEPKELAEAMKVEVEAGLRTRNEARLVLGLPPDGDPDDPENPANVLTANVLNNVAPLGAMSTTPAPDGPGTPPAPATPSL